MRGNESRTVLPVYDCTTGLISTQPTCAMWMGIS
jgi:hypothetical protein